MADWLEAKFLTGEWKWVPEEHSWPCPHYQTWRRTWNGIPQALRWVSVYAEASNQDSVRDASNLDV